MRGKSMRLWASLILFGLVGQFAWTIENMYFNVFLYNTITQDPTYIAAMVAASAVAATLTTLFMGALSDRVGKRKAFICGGYLLWGVSTAAFGFISVENMQGLFPAANAVHLAAVAVIVMDCVMTFFGSTANDAAFNAYVTDTVEDGKRGKVESVLAILPLISMLVIFGLFDSMTQKGEWQKFFLIFGALTTLTGLIGLMLIKDPPLAKKSEPFWQSLLYGFRPSVIGQHPKLYLSLACACVFSIAVQIFFPYLIIYMQHYLGLDSYALVLGVVLIVASLASVLLGRLIDKVGKLRFTLISAVTMLLGLILMYIARDMIFVMVAGSVMMSGYMLVTAALSAQVRDLTPKDKAGHFQGIRMIFAVMLPMLIGPFIGSHVIVSSGATYVELGVVKAVPTPSIFLAAGIALFALAVPVFFLRRLDKRENNMG